MKRHFNTHIQGIDLKFWHELIKSHGKLVTLKRGEYLSHRDEPTNALGFVLSGYLLYTILKENKPVGIGGFAFADALCGDYPNCMYNAPATFDIVAGRKTELWLMDATMLPSLYDSNPVIGRHGRIVMEQVFNSLLTRYYAICAMSPQERYLDLITEHPQIEQDVSQKEIAKYLHISPIHLCRIRKEILRQ